MQTPLRRAVGFVVTVFCILAAIPWLRAAPAKFPLQAGADGRHLTDSAGKPFLVLGDSAWSLIAQLPEADAARYLDDRAGRGFSAIIVNLIEHKFASRAPALRDGVPPFLKPGDFTQPNPAYFAYAHRIIAAAQRRGISVWLCPAYLGWGGGDEGWFKEIKAGGPTALHGYGRFVGERFADLSNVVWIMGGDFALPPAERWTGNELAAGLREGGARQLMTAHGGQTAATETFGDASWLAVDAVYSYVADLYRPLLAAHARQPARPFVLIETIYEGEHDSRPEQIRRQAWWAMLGGAAGQFFGNNPIWHFDGPTLFPHQDTWQQALNGTGTQDMARLGAFFAGRPWPALVPDSDNPFVANARNGPGHIAAAVTADRRLAVLYAPADDQPAREIVLNLDRFPGPVTATWFNPAKDTPRGAPGFVLPNRGSQTVRTPGENGTGANDWVLTLEAR